MGPLKVRIRKKLRKLESLMSLEVQGWMRFPECATRETDSETQGMAQE